VHRYELRVSTAARVVLGGVWFALALLWMVADLRQGRFGSLGMAVPLAVGVAALVLLSRYRIVVADGTLTYATPWSTKTVALSEVHGVRLSSPLKPHQPTMSLYVMRSSRSGGGASEATPPAMVINAKLFHRAGIRRLIQILEGRADAH
jgi:hypothetical protein